MADFCHDAALKVERANKHIGDVKDAIRLLEQTYTGDIQIDKETGRQEITHRVPQFAVDLQKLSLIVGDAIHNLHTALDFAWCDTIKRRLPDKLSPYTKFPVAKTAQELEARLHGIQVDSRCKTLFDFIVSVVRAYDGPHNSAVWTLHDLDINDKHVILLKHAPHAAIQGIVLRDNDGHIYRGQSMAVARYGPYTVSFGTGVHVEDKGILSVDITLEEAGPFQSVRIDELLPFFSYNVFYIVKRLGEC